MSQSLDRALGLLRELAEGPRTLDELAATACVHKTTVLRLLRTLETQRFVSRMDSRRYQLGSALFDLANRALESRDVRAAVRPVLAGLNERTGHTVHLAGYEDGVVVYLDKMDSRHPVRMYSRVGRPAPLHCTAVAKVLLAAQPPDVRATIAQTLDYEPKTPNTITTPVALLEELATVAAQGHAVDAAEHEEFVNCVAAPIRGPDGAVVAAMSITVPTMITDLAGVLDLLPHLTEAAAAASAECGWNPTDSNPTDSNPTDSTREN